MSVKRVYLVGVICLQDFVVYYALNLSIFILLVCLNTFIIYFLRVTICIEVLIYLRKVEHDKFFVFYFQFAYIRSFYHLYVCMSIFISDITRARDIKVCINAADYLRKKLSYKECCFFCFSYLYSIIKLIKFVYFSVLVLKRK